MKYCDICGAKNATRAQFCSRCGEKFRIVDAETIERSESESENLDAPKKRRRSHSRELAARRTITTVARRKNDEQNEKLNAATVKLGETFWAFIVAGGAFLVRLVAPLVAPVGRWIFAWFRDIIVHALSPSSTWDPKRPPNFLYWGLLDAIIFQLPFSLVGIIYAVLANSARKDVEFARARKLAESAKNWLLFDLSVGIIVTVFQKLVFRQ